jgi:adenosylcobinamide kinase/adenosylcobinamide-phosphate guanylyltransferase
MGRRLTLILGGARSGKSRYAQELAGRWGGRVLYVATAAALDSEMAARIAAHKRERPPAWDVLEQTSQVGPAVAEFLDHRFIEVVIVDCLTLLASNVLSALPEPLDPAHVESALNAEVTELLRVYEGSTALWLIISNEVGMGIVPPYPLGRSYRDALGRINQRVAATADEVVFLVAGLPMKLKGEST